MIVVIHAEEEFDWYGGYSKENTLIDHYDKLFSLVNDISTFEIPIVICADYPFINNIKFENFLKNVQSLDRDISFGAQLHPWVNPPFDNDDYSIVSNSFGCNLSYEIERKKIKNLTDLILDKTGNQPTLYLGGRYGADSDTMRILSELGYKIDFSISPFMDYSTEGGPDYSSYGNSNLTDHGINRIPHSIGIISSFHSLSVFLTRKPDFFNRINQYRIIKTIFKIFGVKKVRLSPEGHTVTELKKLIRVMLSLRYQNLIFSFHSSSCKVGATPYVSTILELNNFYETIFDTLHYYRNTYSNENDIENQI